jgi:hypothetical protein
MSKLLLWMALSHSLVWGQYVHPFGSPHFAQPQNIPSDYYLNLNREITLINSLKMGPTMGKGYAGKDWILFDYETYEENQSIDGFAPLELLDKSQPVQASEILYFSQLQGYGISSGELLGISDKAMLIDQTIYSNELSMGRIISPANKVLFNEIEPFRSSFNSSFSIRTNNGSHSPKTDPNKSDQTVHNLKSLSFREVLGQYPTYKFIPFNNAPFLNIFKIDNEPDFTFSNASNEHLLTNHTTSKRQRRAVWSSATAYNWEINDFNGSSASNDSLLQFDPGSDINASSSTPFKLNVIANDGIDSLAVLAWGHIGGNALIDFADASGFKFLTHNKHDTSLTTGNVSSSFEIRVTDAATGQTGIDSWLNDSDWHSWGVYAKDTGNTREFFLTYDYNPLNYSVVPEPSTYFMTGALFCLIGCNRSSRNVFNSIVSKAFNHWKTKPKCLDIQKRIS